MNPLTNCRFGPLGHGHPRPRKLQEKIGLQKPKGTPQIPSDFRILLDKNLCRLSLEVVEFETALAKYGADQSVRISFTYLLTLS